MRKNELIENIAKNTGISKTSCEAVIDSFADEIKTALIAGDKVMLKGFMSMEITERPEREGRNPQTGNIVKFPSVKSVKCRVSKAIRDAINGK